MGSEYQVNEPTTRAILRKMQAFIREAPQGRRFEVTERGETVPLIVAFTSCTSLKPEQLTLSKVGHQICSIGLHDEVYGGDAYYHLYDDGSFEISAPDFRYPLEYILANKHFVKMTEEQDWCITEEGEATPTRCSKRRW